MSGPALTVDVVAFAGDPARSVLLIQRRHDPFAGAWALPGGFVESGERVAAAAARELAEETGVVAGPLEWLGIYDTPGRDPRGSTISAVYVMRSEQELDALGADDAGAATWFALDALPPLAFDHDEVVADAIRLAASGRRT